MANILLIETSTKACSVSLCKDFNIEFHEEEYDGPNHASSLGLFVEREIKEGDTFNVWGVVVLVIHKATRRR